MHTPGPWTANPDGLIHAGKNRLHIAQAANTGMGHAAAANARLMAAAPDMLAALQSILNIALVDAGPWSKTIQQEAQAAIKTATGA